MFFMLRCPPRAIFNEADGVISVDTYSNDSVNDDSLTRKSSLSTAEGGAPNCGSGNSRRCTPALSATSSTSPPAIANQQQPSAATLSLCCAVCGDVSSGKHYGIKNKHHTFTNCKLQLLLFSESEIGIKITIFCVFSQKQIFFIKVRI